MSNGLQSLSQIYQNRIFRIPDYQRGYAWKQEQLVDFWDDLMNLQKDRYHYTGLLSMKELPNSLFAKNEPDDVWVSDNGYKAFHIVDGQQRLTTFVILINEIMSFVKTLECNKGKTEDEIFIKYDKLSDVRAKYISKIKRPHNQIISYLFGYEADNPIALYLKHAILGAPGAGSISETYYTKNLKYAKEFFEGCLQKLYESENTNGIEDIYKKVTLQLKFNILEIEDDYDVFVAFETMNNRGKKLTNLELLKNRMIYLTTLFDESAFDAAEKDSLRRQINDAWKEIYFQLGRNVKILLSDDEFLRAHWIMYFQYTRHHGEDYIKFLLGKFSAKNVYKKMVVAIAEDEIPEESNLANDDEDPDDEQNITDNNLVGELTLDQIRQYVISLKETAKYWYASYFPFEMIDLTEDEKEWLDKLNRIGINYFRPLVTAAMASSTHTSPAQRVNLYQAIERFIFVAFRMAVFQSNYASSEYYHKAKELYYGKININEIIQDIRERTSKELPFSMSSFVTRTDKRFQSGDGFYSWHDLRYILFEYEYEKSIQYKIEKVKWSLFTKFEKDKVTIEHILPQTPSKWYWRNQFRQFSAEEIKTLSGSLGNLLPLAQSINSSMQNDSFDKKKKSVSGSQRGYENGSHSEIEVSKETDWNAEQIKSRGLRMLDFMEKRWQINFGTEEEKMKLLHIAFVDDGRPVPTELSQTTEMFLKNDGLVNDSPKTSTRDLQLSFWQKFVDYCIATGREKDIAIMKPIADNWYDVSIGIPDYHIFFSMVGKSNLRIGLYVYKPSAFKRIEGKKEQIELACGFNMDWYSSRKNSYAKRILYGIQTDVFEPENAKFCFDWMIEHFDIIKAALDRYDMDVIGVRE